MAFSHTFPIRQWPRGHPVLSRSSLSTPLDSDTLLCCVVKYSAAMAESAHRVLFCIVDGEEVVFKVKVPVSDDIADLKDRILQQGIDTEYQVRSKRLTLWKVNTLSMSVSMLQLTALGSSANHYSSHPSMIWSIAYGNEAPTSHNLLRSCTSLHSKFHIGFRKSPWMIISISS